MKKFFFFVFIFISLFSPNKLLAQEQNFGGVNVDPLNPGGNPSPSDLAEMGVGLVRLVYKDNPTVNNYINDLISNGIKPVLVLNWEANPQAWYDGNVESYVSNFESYVVNPALNLYGNQVIYQIWNEPDGVAGTIPLSPYEYQKILSAAYDIINNVPGTTTITAGMVSGNLNYVIELVALSGGVLPADGIAIHPYIIDLVAVVNGIKNLAAATGSPVWITEFGWETKDQQAQADWLASVYSLMGDPQLNSVLQATMWYAWSDLMNDGFGLFDASGNPKLSFQEFLEAMLGEDLAKEFLEKFDFIPFDATEERPGFWGYTGDDYGISPGQAFIMNGHGDPDLEDKAKREMNLTSFEIAIISSIGESTSGSIKKIIPPGEKDQTKKEKSLGFVEFYYCKKNSFDWPKAMDEKLWFEVPDYYQEMATSTYQVGDLISLPGKNIPHPLSVSEKQTKTFANKTNKSGPVLLSPADDGGFVFIIDSSSYCDLSGCTVSVNGSERNGHMWVEINGQHLGMNYIPGPGEAPGTYHYSFPSPCSPGDSCVANLKVVNYDREDHADISSSCIIGAGETTCSFSGAQAITKPDPPQCILKNYYLGKRMRTEFVPFGGSAKFGTFLSVIKEVKSIFDEIGDWIEDIFRYEDLEYVVIPQIHTPWTKAAEQIYRQRVVVPATLPGHSVSYEPAEIDVGYKSRDSAGAEESYSELKGSVHGVKGEDEAWRKMLEIYSPPGWDL